MRKEDILEKKIMPAVISLAVVLGFISIMIYGILTNNFNSIGYVMGHITVPLAFVINHYLK